MTVHLDHLGSTPLHPAASVAVPRGLTDAPHQAAEEAIRILDEARAHVAAFIGTVHVEGVTFTSGIDESMNQLVKGVAWSKMRRGRKLAIAASEHLNVQKSASWLAQRGWEFAKLAVDSDGRVEVGQLSEDVILVSTAAANHETGVIQDLEGLARQVRAQCKHAVIISDVSILAGRGSIEVDAWGIDAIALDGAVLGAPRGVGITWVRAGLRLDPLVHGGGQENGRRAGPVNLAGAAAMGAVCEAVSTAQNESINQMTPLLSKLKKHLAGRMLNPQFNSPNEGVAAGVLNLGFPPIAAEPLIIEIDRLGVAVASSSACASSAGAPSHVLRAMGRSDAEAAAAIRISLSPQSTEREIDVLIDALDASIRTMRRLG